MAYPFSIDADEPDVFSAALTTGERLFLVRAAADLVELLGQDDAGEPSTGLPTDVPFPFDVPMDPSVGEAFDSGADLFADEPGLFTDAEPSELGSQLEEVLAALTESQDLALPTDPAVRRLLPDASLDPDVASEFRRYTDFDLREQKVRRLLQLSDLLTDVDPSADDDEHMELVVMSSEAEAIAGALTDIRLVLGERLDLRTDQDAQDLHDDVVGYAELLAQDDGFDIEDEDAERRYIMGMLFELAGFLQESLTECMLYELRQRRR